MSLAAVPGQDHKHHEPVKQQKLWAKAHSSFSDLRSRYVRTSSHSLCFMAYQWKSVSGWLAWRVVSLYT